ncbi:hypothetical protein BKA70DRAFT_1229919 [Coprinopsis sp. MPI-PUGE-AT-0042]|nr:hypothetical protein BKA70DRAFT_1229919 [Coprinopsis sp. MPI-PUGE-AT-0042]
MSGSQFESDAPELAVTTSKPSNHNPAAAAAGTKTRAMTGQDEPVRVTRSSTRSGLASLFSFSAFAAKLPPSFSITKLLRCAVEPGGGIEGSVSSVNDDVGKLSQRLDTVEEEMRGSVCEAPALSQTLQEPLKRVESIERLAEVLRGDVVKATSLANHDKREFDDLSRPFNDGMAKNRVQVQDFQHENREIHQQLDQATEQLSDLLDARWLEATHQSDCDIASLKRRTDDLSSEVTGLRSEARKPSRSRPTISAAAQTLPASIIAPFPLYSPQPLHSVAPRPPPSRPSSVPARRRASWSHPLSPRLGAEVPNWRRPSPPLATLLHYSPSATPQTHHCEIGFATRSNECPYCHRPWSHRKRRRRRIPDY